MSRIDLDVPFAEKDEAKKLGARWDPAQKTWYVPEGQDSAPFQKWHPLAPTTLTLPDAIEFVLNADGELVARLDDLEVGFKGNECFIRIWCARTDVPCDYSDMGCPEGQEHHHSTCPKVNECPYEFTENGIDACTFMGGMTRSSAEAKIRDMFQKGHDGLAHRHRWPQPAATIFATVPWCFRA